MKKYGFIALIIGLVLMFIYRPVNLIEQDDYSTSNTHVEIFKDGEFFSLNNQEELLNYLSEQRIRKTFFQSTRYGFSGTIIHVNTNKEFATIRLGSDNYVSKSNNYYKIINREKVQSYVEEFIEKNRAL